jgi:hypothetical protein
VAKITIAPRRNIRAGDVHHGLFFDTMGDSGPGGLSKARDASAFELRRDAKHGSVKLGKIGRGIHNRLGN